nr:hypothetical protein [Morchella crassipes]
MSIYIIKPNSHPHSVPLCGWGEGRGRNFGEPSPPRSPPPLLSLDLQRPPPHYVGGDAVGPPGGCQQLKASPLLMGTPPWKGVPPPEEGDAAPLSLKERGGALPPPSPPPPPFSQLLHA